MKLIEITKNGKTILTGSGEQAIKNPIEIKFIIDENDYKKLENITNYYKWHMYDALSTFCKNSETLLPEMEANLQFKD